jgi:hypothetical protein
MGFGAASLQNWVAFPTRSEANRDLESYFAVEEVTSNLHNRYFLRRKTAVTRLDGRVFPRRHGEEAELVSGFGTFSLELFIPLTKKSRQEVGRSLTASIWDVSSPSPHRGNAGGSSEEDLSAPSKEPETNPWFPQAHEHPSRARGDQAPSPQRAKEAYRQRAQEIGRGDRPRPAPGAGPRPSSAKAVEFYSGSAKWRPILGPNAGRLCYAAC